MNKLYKKLIAVMFAALTILSLAACNHNNPVENTVNNDPPVSDTQAEDNQAPSKNDVLENKKMFIETENYSMTFDILGQWQEYAGTSSMRQESVAMLTSSSDDSTAYFYIKIFPKTSEITSVKDFIVSKIREKYSSVEFDSLTDASTDEKTKIIATYIVPEGNSSVKKYQLATVQDDYIICYIYSAPQLIYNSQKGYINDMIDSAVFSSGSTTQEHAPVADKTQDDATNN